MMINPSQTLYRFVDLQGHFTSGCLAEFHEVCEQFFPRTSDMSINYIKKGELSKHFYLIMYH